MCSGMFKSPSMPAPPPPVALPEPMKDAEEQIATGRRDTRRRAAALASLSGSRLTSPLGLTSQADTTQKSLLGQ